MKLLNKLERRFGRFAIKGLMRYVIVIYILGFVISKVNPLFYYQWLMLDIDRVLSGEVWRLITFVIQPVDNNILLFIIMIPAYYMVGTSLEREWGSFKFNLYYFTGIIFNELIVVAVYLILGISFPVSLSIVTQTLFLAFFMMFPDVQFFYMFLIPLKGKYLSIIYVLSIGVELYDAFSKGGWIYGTIYLVTILVGTGNFLIFFFATKKDRLSPKNIKRKMEFRSEVKRNQAGSNVVQFGGAKMITRHKCAVCGRTELDDDTLEFRFCSKCDGNYEYCSEHLYSHQHVTKQD